MVSAEILGRPAVPPRLRPSCFSHRPPTFILKPRVPARISDLVEAALVLESRLGRATGPGDRRPRGGHGRGRGGARRRPRGHRRARARVRLAVFAAAGMHVPLAARPVLVALIGIVNTLTLSAAWSCSWSRPGWLGCWPPPGPPGAPPSSTSWPRSPPNVRRLTCWFAGRIRRDETQSSSRSRVSVWPPAPTRCGWPRTSRPTARLNPARPSRSWSAHRCWAAGRPRGGRGPRTDRAP
jgi:hypothetical protein